MFVGIENNRDRGEPGRHLGKPGNTVAKSLKSICPCGVPVHLGEAPVCTGIARCPGYLRFAPYRSGLSRSSPDAFTVSHVVVPVLPGFDISHGSPWLAPVVLNILMPP